MKEGGQGCKTKRKSFECGSHYFTGRSRRLQESRDAPTTSLSPPAKNRQVQFIMVRCLHGQVDVSARLNMAQVKINLHLKICLVFFFLSVH